MAKYKVSLGVKIWTNWEIVVAAESEDEARSKALILFEMDNLAGEYIDPYYNDDAELMGGDAVYIEKLGD